MQFLANPSEVRPGVAAILFLVLMCVLIPAAAVRQHRQLAKEERLGEELTPTAIYTSAMVTHLVLLLLVWAVVREQRIDLFPAYRPTVMHVLIAVAALGVGLLTLLDRFQQNDPVAEQRTRLMAPRTLRERALFVAMAISAGFSEQIAYRGALFIVLAALLGSWWLAALTGAAAFGIAHSFQGWKSAGIVTLVALLYQIVVGLTGTLILAILIHMVHDIVAGFVLASRVRREAAVAAATLATS